MFEMLAHEHELGSETLSPFIGSSVDIVHQTSPPVAFWIHQYSWMLGLFNRRAAAQQSNFVINWLLLATYPEKWNFIKLFVDFNAHSVCSVLPR